MTSVCSNNQWSEGGVVTCQCGGVSEGSDLRVGQTREQGDDRVHHVLVVDDAVLTLADQNADELTEVVAELFPDWPRHGEGIISTVLVTWTKGVTTIRQTNRGRLQKPGSVPQYWQGNHANSFHFCLNLNLTECCSWCWLIFKKLITLFRGCSIWTFCWYPIG